MFGGGLCSNHCLKTKQILTHVDKFLQALLLTRLVETPPKWNFPIERHDNNARKLCENSARRRELPRLLRI